jgi:uncharacterized protein YceK
MKGIGFRAVLVVMMAILLGGCALLQRNNPGDDLPEVMIHGMELVNHGQAYVSAVRVLVPVTGQFVSCGNVAPRGRCASGFPEQRYSGNAIEITWSEGGSIYSTGELRLELPDTVIEAGAAVVWIHLTGPGSAAAVLVPVP